MLLLPDVMENNSKGIFKVLDDFCKMNCQTSAKFAQSAVTNWVNNSILVMPKLNKIQNKAGFVIRHFVGDVLYDAVSLRVLTHTIEKKPFAIFLYSYSFSRTIS